jgi:hypothetical protein
MPRPVGVPVILVDGPSAGQVIYTDELATAWHVAKPLEAVVCISPLDLGNWTPLQSILYRITEYGITLPTRSRGEPAHFRRRIGWSEGAEPDEILLRCHVRAALLEHPDLMPAGTILWPADPADDQPIRVLETGSGPALQCADHMQMDEATREIRGHCPCGWRTEFVPSRRYEELRALASAHVEAAILWLRTATAGVSFADYAAMEGILDEANRRPGFDGIIASMDRAVYPSPSRAEYGASVGQLDWGDPLSESDANWPSQGDTCAHICGADPDHRCQARATTRLVYKLPSGGTRSMPICAPCHESETAAKEHADA